MAVKHGTGFILESPTWRASPDWGAEARLRPRPACRANRAAIAMMHDIRDARATARTPLVVSGNIGPRGDGYDPGALMSPWEAEAYHAWQIGVFADAGADLVSAVTLTNVNEAIGVTRAAEGRRHAMRDFLHRSKPTAGFRPGRASPRRSRPWTGRPITDPPTT